MKKYSSLLLAFLVTFLSIFVSCEENDGFEYLNRCKITVTCTEGGKVKISKYLETTELVQIGSEIEVVATADKGYAFSGWYLGDSTEPVSTDAVFTFVATKNSTLTAHFTKLSNLTIISAGNGSVSFKDFADTSIAVMTGSEVTVVATPYDDCDFIGWFIGDEETPVSTDAEYTFTVEENATLIAKFSKRPVITVCSAGNGYVSIKDAYGTSKAFLAGSEVTVVATPYDDCDFIGWFIGDEETPVSADAEYTFIVADDDMTLTAKFKSLLSINGHEYVDLGLPSGLKWATCNVGASKPEEYGGYYAWGETEEKGNYDWNTYKWCDNSEDAVTKYGNDKRVLDLEDDVAHIKWGSSWQGSWRMPTKTEQDELLDNCTWTWTTQNGVKGYRVTGPNGYNIFLPAAGCCNGRELYDSGTHGYYWSSSVDYGRSCFAHDLYFHSCYYGWYDYYRCSGRSVRPVCE